MCPRNPVTWGTHAYFSHLRRFTGAHRLALWAHKQTPGFCLFVCVNVCVFSTPLSPFLILAIVFSPLPRGSRQSLSRRALGKLFSFLFLVFEVVEIPSTPPPWHPRKQPSERRMNTDFISIRRKIKSTLSLKHRRRNKKRGRLFVPVINTFWAWRQKHLCQIVSYLNKLSQLVTVWSPLNNLHKIRATEKISLIWEFKFWLLKSK